jgi:cis-3-alkyl-4-acyloxetan-2-one decarboxylase
MLGKPLLHYTIGNMSNRIFDRFWHQTLHKPYNLVKKVDSGSGPIVVLLHGLGRNGEVWHQLVDELAGEPVRVVAFDLLGFGDSPKPVWLDYNADDHAKAVANSIERLRPEAPVIVVGHSMGCLVAVRLAALRPDLVKHLVLYEMPLYKGLPNKRYYRLRLNVYNKIYNWILRLEPTFDANKTKFSDRMARKLNNLEVEPSSWRPYVKSLQHTIHEQTAPEDIPNLSMPMDVIYGSFDMLVIKGTVQYVYGKQQDERLQTHTVRAGHSISKKASKLLAERIIAALQMSAPLS